MMIGDLAISGSEDTNQQLHFPHRAPGNEPFPAGSGYVIKGFRQKIVPIASNLVMAWSGRMVDAMHLARQLQSFVSESHRTWPEIRSFLQNFDKNVLGELALIFIFTEGSTVEYLGLNASILPDGKGDKPGVAIGSGGELIWKDIQALKNLSSSVEKIDNPLNEHYTKCVGLLAALIRKELTNSSGFEHYYGGGYELCGTTGDGKIDKLDGVTFAFWDIRIAGSSPEDCTISAHPSHVTRYVYVGEVLVIKSLHLELLSEEMIDIKAGRITYVYPLLSEKTGSLIDDLTLESNIVCSLMSIFINNRPNAVAGLTANQFLSNPDAALEITQIDAHRAKYRINVGVLKRVLNQVLRKLPAHIWETSHH